MAATLTTLAELIVESYAAAWVTAMTENTFLLQRLESRGNVKRGAGAKLQWKAKYAGNTSATSYSEVEAAAGAGNQAFKNAELAWKLNRVEVSVGGLTQAAGASGGMIADPVQVEVQNGLRDLRKEITSQLMTDGTGNTSKDITGLLAAIADTGTYANLDRASYTWWKSYVNDNSGTPRNLTEILMRDVLSTLEERGAEISAIYTGQAQWYKYGDLLRSERRQQNPTTMIGGYQALEYEGRPLIKIPGYPTGRIDFVDENQIEFHILPPASGQGASLNLRNVVALPDAASFGILPLGQTKDSTDFWLIAYTQLRVNNPYHQGSLQDLS